MLSRNHDLTKLLVLKRHEKVLHKIVKKILIELRSKFWINRGRIYIRELLNTCFIYKCLQSQSYSYPEKLNLPGYCVNHTVPFQVCGVSYLGPVFLNNTYHIIVVTIRYIKLTLFYLPVVRQE